MNRLRHNKLLTLPALVISLILGCGLSFCLFASEQAVNNSIKKKNEKQNFSRPKPVKPVTPQVPSANRYRQDKIFLEYADSLYKIKSNDTLEKQILKGDVKFRQGGMWMYCDSAYYYPEDNSLDAFGNVKMEQGDTLFVYADKLFYNGDTRMAKLKNGPTRDKVKLINKDVTLTTDSLDYSLEFDVGWYEKWGTIDDKVNTLTSLFGEYSTATKDAEFFKDVVLVNNRDGYTLLTDTLYYNTSTHIANIESLAEIRSENDTIFTRRAVYDTETGNADLLTRSTIVHRDSTGNVITLDGDSIIYDKASHISRAYMFRDRLKNSMPMVLTDTARKMTLIGGYGIFNDSTREALSTIYPLLMDYSQGDTLFLRSDTIKTWVVSELVPVTRKWGKDRFPQIDGRPLVKVDSLTLYIDSIFFSLIPPMVNLPILMISERVPQENVIADIQPIETEFPKDVEPESLSGLINEIDGEQIVQEENQEEKEERAENDNSDKPEMELRDFHVALAYYNARFFKKDIQGVADSILFDERDSILFLFRKPIVWSGERQVTGNRIDVHLNDSTADWAYLPESGLMSEHVDEDFYNQIAGKEMKAFFADETLKRLEVSGNVETIFLPQESDSTFNRLVQAESSYLTIDMDDGKMDRLKMWPEVNGTVTPIFLVKRNQMYLQKFRWWAALRPKREWYGGRVVWADDLGEVPADLQEYFKAPSEFGEPKTFSSSRVLSTQTSLPVWDDLEAQQPEEMPEIPNLVPQDYEGDEMTLPEYQEIIEQQDVMIDNAGQQSKEIIEQDNQPKEIIQQEELIENE